MGGILPQRARALDAAGPAAYSTRMSDEPVYFRQLQLGQMQNFIYLIGDPATRRAAVIDPGWDIPRILEQLRHDDYRLEGVFLTHTHPDHWLGLPALLEVLD